MSAGQFTNNFYETSSENGGFILRCRVQPETLAAEIGGLRMLGLLGLLLPLVVLPAPRAAVVRASICVMSLLGGLQAGPQTTQATLCASLFLTRPPSQRGR